MAWFRDTRERLAASGEGFALLTQPAFDRLAARQSHRGMRWAAAGIAGVLVAILLATSVFVPRLVREARLLWFGTETDAIVRTASLTETGNTKGGSPLYRLIVDFEFQVAGGARQLGRGERSDLQTPVFFRPGDRVRIMYAPAEPARNALVHNLAIDVYALLLFLPFMLLVPGGFSALYLYRYTRWRKAEAAGPA